MVAKLSQPFRILLTIAFLAFSLQPPPALAEMVGAGDVAAQQDSSADRAKVEAFLERANVKERLQAMGVEGMVAKDRVAAMSDQEVRTLAQRIDGMPAGAALSNTDLILIILIAILIAIAI